MGDEVILKTNSAEDETKTSSETTTALTTINTGELNKESLEIINQIIAETDIEKTKDLTYLFNINQNKKTMVRMDKLNTLQDNLVDQFSKRIAERPDQISNQEIMQGLKIVQDMLERGQKQIVGVDEAPLIQINQQTNSVNVGDKSHNLNRESRDRVANVVTDLLSSLIAVNEPTTQDDILDNTEVIEAEYSSTSEENQDD